MVGMKEGQGKGMGQMVKWWIVLFCALFFWMQGSEGKFTRSWASPSIFHTYVGQMRAPDFSLEDLQGKMVNIRDYRGQVVLLNFWATWCPDCRKEGPSFNTLHNQYRSQGFALFRIDTKESREAILKFLEKQPAQFSILLDTKGKVGRLFGVWAHPTTYLIDRQGIVRYRSVGAVDWTNAEAKGIIEQLLHER